MVSTTEVSPQSNQRLGEDGRNSGSLDCYAFKL